MQGPETCAAASAESRSGDATHVVVRDAQHAVVPRSPELQRRKDRRMARRRRSAQRPAARRRGPAPSTSHPTCRQHLSARCGKADEIGERRAGRKADGTLPRRSRRSSSQLAAIASAAAAAGARDGCRHSWSPGARHPVGRNPDRMRPPMTQPKKRGPSSRESPGSAFGGKLVITMVPALPRSGRASRNISMRAGYDCSGRCGSSVNFVAETRGVLRRALKNFAGRFAPS